MNPPPHADAYAEARADTPDVDESYDDEPAEDDDDVSSTAANNPVGGTATEEEEEEPTVYSSVRSLQSLSHLRDISDAAVAWQVSSAKPGNGVEQLRDTGTETYWQSDGTSQPHYIQIHFHRRLAVSHVALYLDYQLDESYTPNTIQLETGMTAQDLTFASPQNQCMELHEPSGWVILPVYSSSMDHAHDPQLSSQNSHGLQQQQSQLSHSKAHLLRISILSMHQNGRDTHVRRVAIFAERTAPAAALVPSLLSVKRKTSPDETKHDRDEDDDGSLTRALTEGFSTLGMLATPFATTIR